MVSRERENWQSRSIAPGSQVQCLLTEANRLNGTSRRASSESGESLRHVGCYPTLWVGKQDSAWWCGVRAAGAALEPPLWTVLPNKALSLSLSLSLMMLGKLADNSNWEIMIITVNFQVATPWCSQGWTQDVYGHPESHIVNRRTPVAPLDSRSWMSRRGRATRVRSPCSPDFPNIMSWFKVEEPHRHGVTARVLVSRVCFLLLQDLLQSCSRGGRRIVEDMCYERRRAEACVD